MDDEELQASQMRAYLASQDQSLPPEQREQMKQASELAGAALALKEAARSAPPASSTPASTRKPSPARSASRKR